MTANEKLNILSENLSVLDSRLDIATEQRLLTLKQICDILSSDLNRLSAREKAKMYKSLVPNMSGYEEMLLYKKISSSKEGLLSLKQALDIGDDVQTPAGSHGKLSYVKSGITELALDILSRRISNPKPVPSPSFTAACESVFEGDCEFCILPIESSDTGKLPSFYSMLDRYDLKICDACDIEDGDTTPIRYALISKDMDCFQKGIGAISKAKNKSFLFEFSVVAEDADFIGRIFSAASCCGAVPLGLDYIPIQYDEILRRYILVFRILGGECVPFRFFLSENHSAYTPLGLYPEPKQ